MVVKIEDYDKDGAVSAGAKILNNACVDQQPHPTHTGVEAEEEGQPSLSSTSNLKSQFIAMGFSPKIVDKMLQKNGEHDPNTILEALLSHSEMVKPLYGEMDRIVSLLEMGFTKEEVSFSIDCFGQEATVEELADSIFARRIANTIEQRQVKVLSELVGKTETEYSDSRGRLRFYDDDDDNRRFKRVKHLFRDDGGASSSRAANTPWLSGGVRSLSNGFVKERDNEMGSGSGANVHVDIGKPPYFLYGNVVDISKDAWHELSDFLFCVQPEFVSTQTFSALSRKEGYIHNLPTDGRHVVGSNSPMTIEGAVPFTIEDSMQPHQLELALGYPSGHTDMLGLSTQERIAAMRFGFQTDTISFLLSSLKEMYPDGLRVLSIYSGVGGAEIALHRLGIPLKCVVSVEESEVNRQILKRWWGKTKQAGQLRQVSSIHKVNTSVLQDLMDEFHGFDLVVGGTCSNCEGGELPANSTLCQFYNYARVVSILRNLYGLR